MQSPTNEAVGGWSWVKPAAVVWAVALAFTGVCYALWKRKIDVHSETGPLEWTQLGVWIAAVLLALAATARARGWRDRMSAGWLGVVAGLATARELDLHERVQAEGSWLPEVHFRLDWLTDPAMPLWPKIFWGVVFVTGAGALLVPPLLMRAPTMLFLRRGDAPTWLLLIAFGMLGMGYASDDILGRGRLGIHYEVTQGAEEVFELLGALAFLMAVWHEGMRSLSARVRSLAAPTISVRGAPVADPAGTGSRAHQHRQD